jgi:hypothetical protein
VVAVGVVERRMKETLIRVQKDARLIHILDGFICN